MERLGYGNKYEILNAMEFGIPQKREYVFVVSILGNNSFDLAKHEKIKVQKRFSKSEYSFFVKQSIETFNIHPFMCPHCKIMMDKQEIYIHKIYF